LQLELEHYCIAKCDI